jgi:urease accessory protein UreF
MLTATQITQVTRRASVSQGAALIRLANDALPLTQYSDTLKEFRKRVRAGAASTSTVTSTATSSSTCGSSHAENSTANKRKRSDHSSEHTDSIAAASGEHCQGLYAGCM